jgi:Tfp pilus assembly protein PilO
MSTQVHRAMCGLMVVLMVAVVAAGWFLVAQPQLASAADAETQIQSVRSQISTSEASLRELRKQKENLGQLTAQLTELQRSIPSTLASSDLVAGFDAEAAAAGVLVTHITVGDPAAYAPLPAGAASTAKNSSGAAASPSPSPTATPTPAPSAPSAQSKQVYVPMTDPRVTGANFIPTPVQISVTGTWDQTLAFVKNLQSGTRLFALGSVSSKFMPDDSAGFSFIVSGYVFSILDPSSVAAQAAEKAAAAGVGATPSPAPTPSGTPSP